MLQKTNNWLGGEQLKRMGALCHPKLILKSCIPTEIAAVPDRLDAIFYVHHATLLCR